MPRYRLPYLAGSIKESGKGKKVNIATYGHAGDGNLHVTIQYRRRNFAETSEAHELLGEIYRKAVEMQGKLSGEHGIGLTARLYVHADGADRDSADETRKRRSIRKGY